MVSAAMVKQLREISGAGMMDAKKALVETKGDMEAAQDWLRTKGLLKAEKKSSRVAAEGLIGVSVKSDSAIIVEVNSETDFVATNEEFKSLVKLVLSQGHYCESIEVTALAASLPFFPLALACLIFKHVIIPLPIGFLLSTDRFIIA